MGLKKIAKLFKQGNVCVTGLRGTGKDVLFGSVINYRKEPYISNIDYSNGKLYQKLDLKNFDIKNNYDNFISNDIIKYEFPYIEKSDVYVSDCGVYFPSQYCGDLNRKYPTFPNYQALSRQIAKHNFHINAQNLNRVWDKIREQSDIYIRCKWCIVLFKKFVIQRVLIYDKYQSCVDRVEKAKVSVPLFSKEGKSNVRIYLDNFRNLHGVIKSKLLFYINRSQHDTYYFGNLLKFGGDFVEKK